MDQVKCSVPLNDLRELLTAAKEVAEDLAAELDARYARRSEQPVQARRYERDMAGVRTVGAVNVVGGCFAGAT